MNASILKRLHIEHNKNSYFFDYKSMRFFGDTMANYSVSKKTVIVSNEINPIEKTECYELKRKRSVSSGLTSSTFFNKDTFEVVFGVKDLLLK